MGLNRADLPVDVLALVAEGIAIPAHPLALDGKRMLDFRRQRALTRYYIDAGARGLAVGVHATQFAIREAGLYEAVLRCAIDEQRVWTGGPFVMIAGLCGPTKQACAEARLAVSLGYHAGLLSLANLEYCSEQQLIEHCGRVADEIPTIGFYLQSAVGGPILSSAFWQRFAEIPNALAIKIAPFNRYRTLDVVRGVVAAGAENRVYLYTGNDDHILLDLTLPFVARRGCEPVVVRIRGGLLGHWSVWTSTAVRHLAEAKRQVSAGGAISPQLLALDSRVTDCNSAFFDVANNFGGCIAGCHEVLRRQGLLEGVWCLDPAEALGPGQRDEIDRVYREHADLADDDFVRANLDRWLA